MSTRPKRSQAKLTLRQVFARNLRLVRIQALLSQERMALEAGLDRAFVGSTERGARNISIDSIEQLCAALGIAAHELLDPNLPEIRGLDASVTRAPRTARPYPPGRRSKRGTGA